MQWLEDAAGRRLAFRSWPAAQPWLHVLISHGFSEHIGWWTHVAEALQARGVSAHLFDHFHHGRSDGRRGDAADYDTLCAGLRLALEAGVTPRRRGGTPLVLLGHSNGALVGLLGLPALPAGAVDALVLASPFLGLSRRDRVKMTLLAPLLERVSPRLMVPLTVRPWRLTGNRRLWPRYLRDRRRFRCVSVRFLRAMQRATARARAERRRLDVPVLLLQGTRDAMVDTGAADAWYAALEAPDKARIDYPGLRHELFNETAWERVLDDVVDWCRARFQPLAAVHGDAR